MKVSLALTTLFVALAASNVQGYTNPITIKGYRMFDAKTGASIAIKGIDYYPRPNAGELNDNNIDFFTDDYAAVWGPDIDYLAATGANAVRLYAVDPSMSHDKFMCALQAKGMYALIDLGASCQNCAITREQYPACYPATLKTRGEMIVLAFAKYDNVLAFSAGNEVNHGLEDFDNNANTNAPCQKKFLRDMRSFIGTCPNIRKIPVGVVLADPDFAKNDRLLNAKYYNCRSDSGDEYENAEWYGINAYQYCDNDQKTLDTATGFLKLQTDFASAKMTIPVMLTEYGCLNKGFPKVKDYEAQRTWLQAGWLYSSNYRKVFSGGFVFEYSTENANSKDSTPASTYPFTSYGPQNYGLGYFSPADCDHKTKPCKYNKMPNYDNLATQYKAVNVATESSQSTFTPDADRATLPACPDMFTALKTISWPSDAVTSRDCPAKQTFTCPGETSDSSSSGTSSTDGTSTSSSGSTSATTEASNGGANHHFSLMRALDRVHDQEGYSTHKHKLELHFENPADKPCCRHTLGRRQAAWHLTSRQSPIKNNQQQSQHKRSRRSNSITYVLVHVGNDIFWGRNAHRKEPVIMFLSMMSWNLRRSVSEQASKASRAPHSIRTVTLGRSLMALANCSLFDLSYPRLVRAKIYYGNRRRILTFSEERIVHPYKSDVGVLIQAMPLKVDTGSKTPTLHR
ncbi:unnamed protein product [Phytophthora lilii]|uniref:Unnamed protein product n=1 Tax=Phytophthora lilii TaxID=2077276 RepID=A0A9W6UCZ3_9STRA|nr:unnamed protein product [Phytophthora lilii]